MQSQDVPADGATVADRDATHRGYRVVRRVGILTIGSAVLSQPVTAQSAICQEALSLPPRLIEGAIVLLVCVGISIAVTVYLATTLLGMVDIGPVGRQQVDQHKRAAYRSAALLIIGGPLLAVVGRLFKIPSTGCIDLIPF
jgi:uncharacterized membrane protein